MGLRELLLRKGRGVGELKDIRNEYSLDAEMIKTIKELHAVDIEAGNARAQKDHAKILYCIRKQVSLIDKIEYYALVKLIRLQYDYKEIGGVLSKYEGHIKSEKKKLRNEEKRLLKERTDEGSQRMIKQHIRTAMAKLEHFSKNIDNMKQSIRTLRKSIKENCKKKMIKVKKAYYFA